ncbi:MAG TPA: hypothetical protein VF476_11135 [Chitinophagaceae bacterium]
MRTLTFICISLIILSCKNQKAGTETAGEKDTAAVTEKTQPGQIVEDQILPVADTGQTWFRVVITRNDSAYMDYEGSWPVFFLAGNSATLQLSKSKNIMSITDILTIYMNGMPSGKVPVVLSNREKGTASMIMSPVTDGAYGLPISLTEGFLNVTKNVDSIVSGNFEGKAIDLDKKRYQFKGYFINAKINPEKI